MKKLYLCTQTEATGYDTYDSVVVCAISSIAAKSYHPSRRESSWNSKFGSWATSPKNVTAKQIGVASPDLPLGVVLARYNGG